MTPILLLAAAPVLALALAVFVYLRGKGLVPRLPPPPEIKVPCWTGTIWTEDDKDRGVAGVSVEAPENLFWPALADAMDKAKDVALVVVSPPGGGPRILSRRERRSLRSVYRGHS